MPPTSHASSRWVTPTAKPARKNDDGTYEATPTTTSCASPSSPAGRSSSWKPRATMQTNALCGFRDAGQRRGGHRRCAPCLVGGALLRLLHGQRLRQPGRHREDDLHICKLLEFPLRGSDGNAILGKLSIKRGRKLSTWFAPSEVADGYPQIETLRVSPPCASLARRVFMCENTKGR